MTPRSRWLVVSGSTLIIGRLLAAGASNDDVMMAWLLHGSVGPGPESIAYYTHVGLSVPIAWLAVVLDEPSVFGWFLLFVHAVAVATLVEVASARGVWRTVGGRWLFGAVLLAEVAALVELSWTTAAFAATVAGLVVLVDGGRVGVSALPGLALVALGAAVRFESAVGATLVVAPGLLWLVLEHGTWRRTMVRAFAVVATVVVLLGIQTTAVRASDDWAWFAEYNDLRGPLIDSTRLDRVDLDHPEVRRIGLTENDLAIFDAWFYSDTELFGMEGMRALTEAVGTEPRVIEVADPSAPTSLGSNLIEHGPKLALLGGMGLVALVWSDRHRWLVALQLATPPLLVAVIVSTLRLHGRVLHGIVLAAAWMLVMIGGPRLGARPSAERWLAVVAAVLVGVLVVHGGIAVVAAVDRRGDELDRFRAMERYDPDGVFVLWEEPVGDLGLFGPAPTVELVLGGWLHNTPVQQAQLDRLGIDDLATAVVDRDDVHLVVPDDRVDLLVTFLAEHRDRVVEESTSPPGDRPPFLPRLVEAG